MTNLSILHYRWGSTAEEIHEELLTTTNFFNSFNSTTTTIFRKQLSRRLFEKPMCGKADMVWLLETIDTLPPPSSYLPSSLSSSLLSLSPQSFSQFSMNTSTSTTTHWISSLSAILQSTNHSTTSPSTILTQQQQQQQQQQIPNQIRRNVLRDLRRGLICYLSGQQDEGGSLLLPHFQSEHHALYSRVVLQLVPSLPIYLLPSSPSSPSSSSSSPSSIQILQILAIDCMNNLPTRFTSLSHK